MTDFQIKSDTKAGDNSSNCVNLILKGAHKRRRLAYSSIKTINSDCGFLPNISVVK